MPTRVSLSWPLEIEASFTISAAEYNAFKLNSYPHQARKTDLSLTFKNSKVSSLSVLSYSFSDMVLVSENYSTDVDGKATVSLLYRSFLGKDEIPIDGLLFYINASNTNSYSSTTAIEDLTFNNYNYTLFDTAKPDPRIIKLQGDTLFSYGEPSADIKMPPQFTICFWMCYFSTTGYRAIISWGDTGEHEIQLNYETVSGPLALSVSNQNAFFNLGAITGTGTWAFVTVTLDQTTKTVKSYINGALSVTASTVGSDFTTSQGKVYLGISNTSDLIEANINKYMLYGRILTSAEITSIYNCTRADVVDLPVI